VFFFFSPCVFCLEIKKKDRDRKNIKYDSTLKFFVD